MPKGGWSLLEVEEEKLLRVMNPAVRGIWSNYLQLDVAKRRERVMDWNEIEMRDVMEHKKKKKGNRDGMHGL